MADINIAFSRNLLGCLRAEPNFRKSGKGLMKDGYVMHLGRDNWEFHGPDKFYWYGRAHNAYEARYKGWSAWLDKEYPEETL